MLAIERTNESMEIDCKRLLPAVQVDLDKAGDGFARLAWENGRIVADYDGPSEPESYEDTHSYTRNAGTCVGGEAE